ncbi:NADPH:quinone oxidoreductase family protein [Coralliovum pocilloporae]|uniref:NADPH:quinone oxidoreductase family protein n=1 Tax=Coralliovum pocilloporae TaxID=3066369 RepID=UPI003307BEC7
MRAVLSHTPGPPSSLVVEELPDPSPQGDEVVIRVEAAALNFFDTLIIRDRYQYKPERPFSPGAECSGIVEAVGPDVTRVKPGDRVCAYCTWGACRELVVVKDRDCIAVPDAVSSDEAAGLIVTYGTTLHAFKDRAGLKEGESVAVLGASGGVGLAAVEIARIMGARVIACASSAEKLDMARQYGAHDFLNYSEEPLKEGLKSRTDGKGVDVVYDPVGGGFAEQAVRATAWLGRFLVIGFAAGDIPKLPLNLVLLKGCDVCGVFWGDAVTRDPDGHRANVEQLLNWCADGQLKPHIGQIVSLEDVPDAIQTLADRKAVGKIIVRP